MAYSYISKVQLPNGDTTYYIKDQYGRNVIGGSAYNTNGYMVGDYVIDAGDTAVSEFENVLLYRCTKAISKIRPASDPYPTWDQARNTYFTQTTIVDELKRLNLADASNVKISGDQTIAGTKTFSGSIQVNGASKIVLSTSDTSATLQKSLDAKQDKLNAGDNITIDNNTISANIPDYVFGQVLFGGTITKITNNVATASITSKLKEKLGIELSSIEVLSTASGSVEGSYGYSQLSDVYFIVNVDDVSFASLSFNKGDWLISIGTTWSKVDNTDAVTSVNGKLGAINVSANKSHIKATLSNTDFQTSSLTYVSGVSCNQKFIQSGIASAKLSGTTTFATAGVTASVSNELLTLAAASTGTIKLTTDSATPVSVEINSESDTSNVITGWKSSPTVSLSLDDSDTSAPQVATDVSVSNS